MILYAIVKGKKIYRKSYYLSLLTSIIALSIASLSFVKIYPGFPFVVTGYLCSALFLYVGVFGYGAFDLMSIVNKHAINEIDVGILSFNNNNILYGINPASKMIGVNNLDINSDIDTIFKNRTDILDFYNNNDLNVKNFKYNDSFLEVKKTYIHENGEYIGKILTVTDITDKISRQQELEVLSEERKILLQEVHHRVKNNLQLVSSFLSLDSRYYKNNPEYVISKTQTRIDAMALAHEEVYQSGDVSNIDVEPLIMNLVNDIFYKNNVSNIHPNFMIESVFMDIDKAMP